MADDFTTVPIQTNGEPYSFTSLQATWTVIPDRVSRQVTSVEEVANGFQRLVEQADTLGGFRVLMPS